MKHPHAFSRRGPDLVSEELAKVLSAKSWFDFKALFPVVHANLKARNAANGGEEMLRLRAYEKLQHLVAGGVVEKVTGQYRGNSPAVTDYLASAAAVNAEFPPSRRPRRATPSTPTR